MYPLHRLFAGLVLLGLTAAPALAQNKAVPNTPGNYNPHVIRHDNALASFPVKRAITMSTRSSGDVTAYVDRASCEASAAALITEDFSEYGGGFTQFTGPLDQTSTNAAFAAGDIEGGLIIDANDPVDGSQGDLLALDPLTIPSLASNAVGSITFANVTRVEFASFDAGDTDETMNIGASTACFDYYTINNNGTDGGQPITIEVYSVDGDLIYSETRTTVQTASFFGVSSATEQIGSVHLVDTGLVDPPAVSETSVVGNVSFDLVGNAPAFEPPTTIAEDGEAPNGLTGTQDATSGADFLTGSMDTGSGDDADCFLIAIADPDGFSAAATGIDTQLYLFDTDLNALFFNDDDPEGTLGLGSRLAAGTLAGMKGGDHVLCVAAFDRDPSNSDGSPFYFDGSPFNVVQTPAPASGDLTLASWNIDGTGGGSYSVALTGANDGDGGGPTANDGGSGMDAPDGLSGTIDASGDTASITGMIDDDADIADCYAIEIADVDAFSATTQNGPEGMDTQLQVFDSDLNAVVFNDDTVGGASGDFRSTVPAGALTGLGYEPGDYVICLTEWRVNAQNAAGENIYEGTGRVVRYPAAPNGDNMLAGWMSTNTIFPGAYQIDLTGTGEVGGGGGDTVPVPAPFAGDTSDSDDTFGPRPFTVGDGTSGSCLQSGTGTDVTYDAIEFQVDMAGTYSVFASFLSGQDGYLHIYEDELIEDDPCVNLIALDDDGPAGVSESFIENVDLVPGQQYVLIVSGFGNDDIGQYDGTFDGPAGASIIFGDGGEEPNACESLDITATVLNSLEVDSSGGFVRFVMEIENSSDEDCEVDVWGMSADALLENGVFTRNPRTPTVPAGMTYRAGYNQRVPGGIADGVYSYSIQIGDFDEDNPMDSDIYDAEDFMIAKGVPTFQAEEHTYAGLKARYLLNRDAEWFKDALQAVRETLPPMDAKDWETVTVENEALIENAPEVAVIAGETYSEAVGTRVGPNPFRSEARFAFDVAVESPVTLRVYDVLGREVATPVDGVLSAGRHTATLSGSGLTAGTYVYRLEIGREVETGRITLAR